MATAWYGHNGIAIDPEQCTEDLWQVSLMTWASVRSMKRHLSPPEEDEEAFVLEINSRLAPAQANAIVNAGHRPNRALYDLSVAIDRLPMHFMRKNEINKNLTPWGGASASCRRRCPSSTPATLRASSPRGSSSTPSTCTSPSKTPGTMWLRCSPWP